jgi:arylsulfatase
VLPIPDRKPVALTTYSAKDPDTKFPPIRLLRPPAGAPNGKGMNRWARGQ